MCRDAVTLFVLAAGTVAGKPSAAPKLQLLSAVEIERQTSYEGPTWIDQALLENWQPDPDAGGFGAELRSAFAGRLRWLRQRQLLAPSDDSGEFGASARHAARPAPARDWNGWLPTFRANSAPPMSPIEGDRRISGIYERAMVTPTAKLALIRRDDTFTLAPWKPALEPLRGQAVIGLVGPNRLTWTPDRGRAPPER